MSSGRSCKRKYYEFSCGHKYVSSPCTCCEYVAFEPGMCDANWRFDNGQVKRTTFRYNCRNCMTQGAHHAYERAKFDYEEALRTLSLDDPKVKEASVEYEQEKRNQERKLRLIDRQCPNVLGWEQVE